MALNGFKEAFHHDEWASGGPDLLQRCLLTICGFGPDVPKTDVVRMTKERFNQEWCGGISVLEYNSFYPFGWMQHERLLDRKTKQELYDILQQSYGVHFFHSSPKPRAADRSIMKPKYYGARKPAYLVLAVDHCPVAVWSKKFF